MSSDQADSSSPMTSSPVSPQKKRLEIKCACGHEAIRLVSKTPKNPDRPFYKCSLADSGDGCKLFRWEDEISGPSYRAGPRTPSSFQSPSSPTMIQTPVQVSSSSSLLVDTPWTNQTPSRPPMGMSLTKRKRSPSPSPTAPHSAPIIRGRDGVIQSTSRSSLTFGSIKIDVTNAFSVSVANPVASTSATGGRGGNASPAKRARVNNASAAGSMPSDNIPIVDNDPSNPFRTHEPPSTASIDIDTSPPSTDPMPTFSRLEELLPDLVSAFPDLRQKITSLETTKAANAESIEAKLKRARALEEEVKELEELRKENARLKVENARLRRE